jgi:hypothetical protein
MSRGHAEPGLETPRIRIDARTVRVDLPEGQHRDLPVKQRLCSLTNEPPSNLKSARDKDPDCPITRWV